MEAQRLEQRTVFDMEMMEATGSCAGIENYSRYLTGRKPGEPPPTLFEYLPDNALVFVDESHVTVPQIGAMFRGDYRRKATLAEYGFRLPSCMDNRPLRFEEWDAMRPQTAFVSATPGGWEIEETGGAFVEQVIRPTGLIDPPVLVRSAKTQVDDLLFEVREVAKRGYRTLVTTLTKRMAEDLTEYMHEAGIRVRYMHSDIETLERIEIIRDLRLGAFDVLIGINLLREGLDIPECGLVAILDADKEGFLRSETSLVQTIGRAARNVDGRVILYADNVTGSMERAMAETDRRREKQIAYNIANGITPESIRSNIHDVMASVYEQDHVTVDIGLADAPMVGHNLAARHRGHGEAHAYGGGRPRVRDGGAAARRDQAAARHRARHRRRSAWRGSRRSRTRPARSKGRANSAGAPFRARRPAPRGGVAGRIKDQDRVRAGAADQRAVDSNAGATRQEAVARRHGPRHRPRDSAPRRGQRTGARAEHRSARQGGRVRRSRARAAQADARRDGPARHAAVRRAAPRPTRTIDVPTEAEKKARRGRPRKTGRPGQ